MEISKRLRMAAELVEGRRVADIGTDHAYLPIWLWEQGRLERGVACDIHRGPLERARENIRQSGAESVIQVRLGDGLAPVAPFEVQTAVLCGMGGMLMLQILENAPRVAASLEQVVLQPQLDLPRVRQGLHRLGFMIREERMEREDGRFYTAISAVPGRESYTPREYLYGKKLLERRDPVLAQALARQLLLLERIPARAADARELREVCTWLSGSGK